MEFVEFSIVNTANLISKVTNSDLHIINIHSTETVYNDIIEINGDEDGFIFNTSFYPIGIDSRAVIINAQSLKFGTYTGEYTSHYSWINEIHSFKVNDGF